MEPCLSRMFMLWFGGRPGSNTAVVFLPRGLFCSFVVLSSGRLCIKEPGEGGWWRGREGKEGRGCGGKKGTAWNRSWLLTFTCMPSVRKRNKCREREKREKGEWSLGWSERWVGGEGGSVWLWLLRLQHAWKGGASEEGQTAEVQAAKSTLKCEVPRRCWDWGNVAV